jgi:glucokinase
LLFKNIGLLMNKDVKGIGIGCAGPLKDGVIKNPPNLPLKNYNIKAELKKRFKVRVEVGNDAHCVALAEAKFGVRKKNFIILTLGTGIGGGIIIDGKLYEGQGFGGEFGHIILDKGKDFESLAAWKSTKESTKKAFGEELLISDLVKMKNKKAEEILNELTTYLAQGIGSLINIFDPEVVVLAGGVRETGSAFLNRIKEKVKKYSILPKITPIQWSKLDHPGTLGASLLVN